MAHLRGCPALRQRQLLLILTLDRERLANVTISLAIASGEAHLGGHGEKGHNQPYFALYFEQLPFR